MFAKKVASTVADVMGAFNKTLADLRGVEALQTAEAKRQRQVAAEASTGASAAEWEAASAREIASKLSALIAPASGTVVNISSAKARA